MVSNKNDKSKRRYELKVRARRQEETRRRITEAAVELHGSVGPARTTIKEVARLAGVRRMTVYNHFPSDAELLDACSSHWLAGNPPPDHQPWSRVSDPDERCHVALDQLYAWYERSHEMMGNTLRDAALVPALGKILEEKWWPLIDAMIGVLEVGRDVAAAPRRRVRAALRLALDFGTWRTLSNAGLKRQEAVAMMARLVGSSA